MFEGRWTGQIVRGVLAAYFKFAKKYTRRAQSQQLHFPHVDTAPRAIVTVNVLPCPTLL
jgi:hypothetical protein